MGDVIDFYKWKQERGRLGATRQRTYQRRPRRGQGREATLTTGSDLSAELRRLLSLE